jgi:hypothetical protein
MEDENGKMRISPWWYLIFVLVILIWVFLGHYLRYILPNPEKYKQMFEAIGALFAGLAFAGIIFSLYLQREDLKLQRRELESTRRELEGQKEQLRMQNETLRLQSFENKFFQLIGLQNDIVNSIEQEIDIATDRKMKGRDSFRIFYRMLRQNYDIRKRKSEMDEEKLINEAYWDLFQNIQGKVGHYFRTLYNIIKFVKNSHIEEKKFYTNLVRAQLSSYELLLLFYNCLSELGIEKFKPLIEEFALLKTVPLEELLHDQHIHFYDPSAFGRDGV